MALDELCRAESERLTLNAFNWSLQKQLNAAFDSVKGPGNVSDQPNGQAVPLIVPFADDAQDALDTFADECDVAYQLASDAGSEPIMAIWARAVE